ncbi:hypothetical protein VTJ83DRAFT_4828 [Remersonia thermophila]|uniref:polynucleotide adenylyltransferase n=1 Tax=Remersonia thermophila TaxID=72144 RepID=A0ABR4DB34_9PEZI
MADAQDPQSLGLEDRVRRLILSHAGDAAADPAPNHGRDGGPPASLAVSPVTPSANPSANPSSAPAAAPKTRKRPNQAQRRQMSAQLSIPVDPRPQFPGSQRAYPGTGHQGYHHPSHHRGGLQHSRVPQPPHSATFRPSGRDNPPPSAPPTGVPFSSRPRHQASLSYHGPMPMPPPDHVGWGPSPNAHRYHHHQQPADPRLPYPMTGMAHMPPAHLDGTEPLHSRQGSADLPNPGRPGPGQEDPAAQAELLERLCQGVVANAEIDTDEIREKERFRVNLEHLARAAIAEYERTQNGLADFPIESVQLRAFGSLVSGFATKGCDMDLGIFSPLSPVQPDAPGSHIPRLIEKAFLDVGLGARLLTKTRVPIIKVCEKPSEDLRQALLAERAKWEKGTAESGDEDEAPEDSDPAAVGDANPNNDPPSQEQAPLDVDQRLKAFKQADAATLPAYYSAAKRLLRQVGGRDITHSSVTDFTPDDILLLNKVILAFVDGLADGKLRERLLSYRTFNRHELTTNPSCRRTLLGVFTQMEGEQMAMLWESRPFQERDKAREMAAEGAVINWSRLQHRSDFGRDPLVFQKQLQIAADQLKKVPSLQILIHAQAPNESASSYCARTQKLLHDLGGHDSRARLDVILPDLVHYYIEGIASPDIRTQVRQFQQAHNVTNLRALGRKHKSLQLAHEYETCLANGVYADDDDAAKVRRYVDLLRDPSASPSANGHPNGTIPLSPEAAALLADIRQFGDPAAAAPNQPRDRYSGALEFPKSGVGVQCDVNFSAHLAVQNTTLLRCYSNCDPRVRPLVLFVKHWAKVRRINTPYRGTLGSYGYVLMMLHYLVNVAQPFVLPNLQHLAHQRPVDPNLSPRQVEETVLLQGRDIRFWRDEAEISRLAHANAITNNHQTVGELLRGFFEYYAKGGGPMSELPCRSFDWGRDVLSLRTPGGLLTKQAKGWTGAKTVVDEVQSAAAAPAPAPAPAPNASPANNPSTLADGAPQRSGNAGAATTPQLAAASMAGPDGGKREVRYRYLFAIEDPFELDHNVARTVTHAGIVSIRDEFRRAWRIIRNARRTTPATATAPSPSPAASAAAGAPGTTTTSTPAGGARQMPPSARPAAGPQGCHPGFRHDPGHGSGQPGQGPYHQPPPAQPHAQGPAQGQGQGGNAAGAGSWKQEDLLEDVGAAEREREREEFARLLEDLHGVAAGELLAEPSGVKT